VEAEVNFEDAGKAYSKDYVEKPFFFIQTSSQGAIRLIAWAFERSRNKALVQGFLNYFPNEAQLLFKCKDPEEEDEKADWQRFHGWTKKEHLLLAVEAHEDVVFRDGYSQLCVRYFPGNDYFVIDEFGVIYVYSNDPHFREILKEKGYDEVKPKWLISDKFHYRYTINEVKARRASFIKSLQLYDVAKEPPAV
jgi:hypothetical protein